MNLLKKLSLTAVLVSTFSVSSASAACGAIKFRDNATFDLTLILGISKGEKVRDYFDCINIKFVNNGAIGYKVGALPSRVNNWLEAIADKGGYIGEKSIGNEDEQLPTESKNEEAELPEVKPSKLLSKLLLGTLIKSQIGRYSERVTAEVFYFQNSNRVSHIAFKLR